MTILKTIRAEIERRYNIYGGGATVRSEDATDATMLELEDLLSFLDTLEELVRKEAGLVGKVETRWHVPSLKQPCIMKMPADKKLKDEIYDYTRKMASEWYPHNDEDFLTEGEFITCMKKVAEHFYELGQKDKPKEESCGEVEIASIKAADRLIEEPKDYAISSRADYLNGAYDGFVAGANWQKGRMMKEAIPFYEILKAVLPGPERGKVKLIIIKEDR